MKTIEIENGKEVQVDLINASKEFAGYGHYKLSVELEYNGEYKIFRQTSTDMQFIDSLSDMEYSDKEDAIYEHIEYAIKERVVEWIYTLID